MYVQSFVLPWVSVCVAEFRKIKFQCEREWVTSKAHFSALFKRIVKNMKKYLASTLLKSKPFLCISCTGSLLVVVAVVVVDGHIKMQIGFRRTLNRLIL